jgi:hypothetical protein
VHTEFWWGKPVGKRQLRRPRRKCEDNITMGVQEVGWGLGGYGLDRSGLG